MSTIPFPGNSETFSALPDGIVSGSRKRRQAFSLMDPDNIENQRMATQRARKRVRLDKGGKEKPNRQASVEGVDDIDDNRSRVFPHNIIESDDDEDIVMTPAVQKKVNLRKPHHYKD